MSNNKKINILIIGKKSFLGSNLSKKLILDFKVDNLTLSQVMKLNPTKCKVYSYIINTTIHKKYIKKKYDPKYDLDRKIIDKFEKHKSIYIFLNSRKIYKPGFNLKENSLLRPVNYYAKNKIITEKYLIKKFNNKFLSLRISNVIGKRLYKKNRRAHNIFLDNFLVLRNKNRKMIVEDEFKDFITIDQFIFLLKKIIRKQLIGIYNFSLGKKVYISEIIYWLDKKFYEKIKFKKSKKDSFTLSNRKLLKKLGISITKNQLKNYCTNLLSL